MLFPSSTGAHGSCLLWSCWLTACPWQAASFVGTVCTVNAEPSLSSHRINFFFFLVNPARTGGGAGRALP